MEQTKESRYNLEKLIKVTVIDRHQSQWYEYCKEKRFLGIKWLEAGFYCTVLNRIANIDMEKHLVDNGVVYEKPKCTLYFENDHCKIFYCETFEEAKSKADIFTWNKNYLIVN